MHSQLLVRDAPIEILIHLPHNLVDLVFRYSETESLEKVLELIALNESVLIRVDLMEHLSQRKRLLVQHLDQVIKDLILNIHLLLFLLDGLHDLIIVSVVEVFELAILDDPVLV